jgi:tRNA-binding EMAP/Myf-like protein
VVIPAATAVAAEPPISVLDIRVGKILSCEFHPEADSLFVEQVRTR